MKHDLSIAIPTYNRSCELFSLINQIIECRIYELVDILIFDDGSESIESSSLFFKSLPANYNTKYFYSDVNGGYPKALLNLFKNCTTEYLMLMADDDQLLPDKVQYLLDVIRERKPDFMSPKRLNKLCDFLVKFGFCYNYIDPKDFFCASAHAPGLVYRVSSCIQSLEILEKKIEMRSSAALVYPQVILAAILLLEKRRCYWYFDHVVKAGYCLPSGIVDSAGAKYMHLESRWRQLRSFDDFFCDLQKLKNDDVLKKMLIANRKRVFGHLVFAMRTESPEFCKAFDRSAYFFYSKQVLKFFIIPILKISKKILAKF